MGHPHLDVLFEDQFSRFVADGLEPEVVVNAYRDRINLGVRSADETVDVFLGGLSAEQARSLGTALVAAAESVEQGTCQESGQTWAVFEPDRGTDRAESDREDSSDGNQAGHTVEDTAGGDSVGENDAE